VHLTWVNVKVYMANDRDFKMLEMKGVEELKDGEERMIDFK